MDVRSNNFPRLEGGAALPPSRDRGGQPAGAIEVLLAARQPEGRHFEEQLAQLEHELRLLRQVSEQRFLIRPRVERLAMYNKAIRAVNAGFDPYVPNPAWLIGFLQAFNRPGVSQLVFNAPLPQGVVDAFGRAKALAIFDVYSVHSPLPDAFKTVYKPLPPPPPQPIHRDPVLVGWLNAAVGASGGYLTVVTKDPNMERLGFIIGAWDLVEDIRLMPMDGTARGEY
jgi:hypothetical protein